MLDFSNPISTTVVVVSVTFLLSIGILYLGHPSWVQKIDSKGKVVIAWSLLIPYAITFSLACGVVTMLLVSKQRGPIEAKSKLGAPPNLAFPSADIAAAFHAAQK